MQSSRGSVDVATRPPDFVSAEASEEPASVELDPSIAELGRSAREYGRLARRLQEEHPEVPGAEVWELIDRARDDLAGSRVQSFMLILVERAVRRGLAAR